MKAVFVVELRLLGAAQLIYDVYSIKSVGLWVWGGEGSIVCILWPFFSGAAALARLFCWFPAELNFDVADLQ